MTKAHSKPTDQTRLAAERSLESFIRLVHPNRVLGRIHVDLISWLTREQRKTHQLVLLPRDHQKSAMAAYYVAWRITKNPDIRILYISATATLAVKQLDFIKEILTCDNYRKFWPEMVALEPSKRKKWTETEIQVDHPRRKQENVRDSTVFCAGLTTTVTGLHCDLAVMDDIVVEENAYSPEGRNKVASQASYLASVAGTEGEVLAVGTRYHPADYYNTMMEMFYHVYDDEGNETESDFLYEVFERKVESIGDGSGEYIWPRQKRPDGKWFGFNQNILAKKRAQYTDQSKFRAQYYNDPTDADNSPIKSSNFQYYDRSHLSVSEGKVAYKGTRLNVFAAIDFAFSLSRKADYSCIVVVGVDFRSNIYILEIERFKTNKISDYFERIVKNHNKWHFRKIRAEVSVAQTAIVKELKDSYIKVHGLALAVEEFRPQKDKVTRINSILEPKYANQQMWHYTGGNCSLLEEELTQAKPAHDDIKDALAAAVEIAVAPTSHNFNGASKVPAFSQYYNKRFGGIG